MYAFPRSLVCAVVASLVTLLPATIAHPEEQSPLDFLIGNWAGTGSGTPGAGQGAFSFQRELQGQVLIRRSTSKYPATADKPAVTHEDLLIVYPDRQRAIYFDNEGHVIEYQVINSTSGNRTTFISVNGSKPAFRIVYEQRSPNELAVSFDISPTGLPEDFRPYVQGTVHRVVP